MNLPKKIISLDLNCGIGDMVFCRVFTESIKHQYERIAITLSKAGMKFWHNDNSARWDFNNKLANLIFNHPPYTYVQYGHYPFYPNERIVKELNNKPARPNLDNLCAGTPLDIQGKYIVITTKVRQIFKHKFEELQGKIALALIKLTEKYKIVILGERVVEQTKEYQTIHNKDQIFGIYDFLIRVIPKDRIIDLSIPIMGNIPPTMPQFQQDCLIMKGAEAIITFGIGGNLWMGTAVANKVIGLRIDNEWTTDLMYPGCPGMYLTKDVNQFCNWIVEL